jgi:hypothetical protein
MIYLVGWFIAQRLRTRFPFAVAIGAHAIVLGGQRAPDDCLHRAADHVEARA